ncbi:MAG TPA: hypothetical protein VF062_07235 [Candidatus Limnocylindrales bacterium]
MRILRKADIAVVVHINDRNRVTVVVPADLSSDETLSMARLVLSPDEMTELEEVIETGPRTAVEAADLPWGRQLPPWDL